MACHPMQHSAGVAIIIELLPRTSTSLAKPLAVLIARLVLAVELVHQDFALPTDKPVILVRPRGLVTRSWCCRSCGGLDIRGALADGIT